eukprot:Amastigsp_a676928_38.p2 type:complete len:116 gc:universal Amastigsp_a676928_38:141-488(+)
MEKVCHMAHTEAGVCAGPGAIILCCDFLLAHGGQERHGSNALVIAGAPISLDLRSLVCSAMAVVFGSVQAISFNTCSQTDSVVERPVVYPCLLSIGFRSRSVAVSGQDAREASSL